MYLSNMGKLNKKYLLLKNGIIYLRCKINLFEGGKTIFEYRLIYEKFIKENRNNFFYTANVIVT